MAYEQAIRSLVLECHRAIAALDGLSDVKAGMTRWRHGPVNRIAVRPDPRCGHLDQALGAAREQGITALAGAIETARPHLNWVTYDLYPRAEIGNRFPEAHAFATIIGSTGFIHADDFELGLFLIAPRTLYRDHRHPAPELYLPLTGPTLWRFGTDRPWVERGALQPVWNEPLAVHATQVRETPFLCLYCWTRDVNLVSKVVAASDWDQIEERL